MPHQGQYGSPREKMDYTAPQRHWVQEDRPLQQPPRIHPRPNTTSTLYAPEGVRKRRDHSEDRRQGFGCKMDTHRERRRYSADPHTINGVRIEMVRQGSLRGQDPQNPQRDIHKARSAGNSPETLPILTALRS